MSLEGLVKEIEDARKMEQARWMATIREQYESTIRAKDEEISVLRNEIETLRRWLDHSALPAANPISKRPEALGLIKLNFGKDKPPPEMWMPGEKDIMDSIGRDMPDEAIDNGPGEITDKEQAEAPDTDLTKIPKTIPEPPKPERVDFPEPEPSEPWEAKLPELKFSEALKPEPSEPHETSPPGPEPHETETLRPVRAARRISRLRGPRTRRAKRPRSRPGKKAG